jgi:hypothetical protein
LRVGDERCTKLSTQEAGTHSNPVIKRPDLSTAKHWTGIKTFVQFTGRRDTQNRLPSSRYWLFPETSIFDKPFFTAAASPDYAVCGSNEKQAPPLPGNGPVP